MQLPTVVNLVRTRESSDAVASALRFNLPVGVVSIVLPSDVG